MMSDDSQSTQLEAINNLLLEVLPPDIRLDYCQFTNTEKSLLRAMFRLSKNGWDCAESIRTIALYARLSVRTVQRLLHGYRNERGVSVQGLKARGIVSEIEPANTALSQPATLRINWKGLKPNPAMLRFLEEASTYELAQGLIKIRAAEA